MEKSKVSRLCQERSKSLLRGFVILKRTFLEFRRSHVVRGEIRPRLIDVCLEPEVRNLLDVATFEQDFHEEDLRKQLLTLFPPICARWREYIESRLLKMMSSCTRFRRGGNKFDLASVFFRCVTCGNTLWYPAVLTHGCLNLVTPSWLGPSLYSDNYDHVAAQFYCRRPFSVDVLDIHVWSGIISKVIQLCGHNPKTATRDQVDRAHARLTCRSCNENGRRKIMTWRTAASFQASSILTCNPDSYAVGSFDQWPVSPAVRLR